MINLEKELASIDDYFQRSKLYNKKVIRQSLLFTYDVFREYEKDCLSLSIMGTFLYDLNIILKSERYIAENIRSTVSPTIYADAYFNECKSLIFELERRAISPELKTMVAMNIAYLEDHYGASIEEYDKAQIHLNNCVDEEFKRISKIMILNGKGINSNPDEAAEYFTKVLKIDPDNPVALNNLGVFNKNPENFEKLISIKELENDPVICYNLAYSLINSEKPNHGKAINLLKKASRFLVFSHKPRELLPYLNSLQNNVENIVSKDLSEEFKNCGMERREEPRYEKDGLFLLS